MADHIVPMSSPELTDADIAAVNEVLETRYLSLGPKLDSPDWWCYTDGVGI